VDALHAAANVVGFAGMVCVILAYAYITAVDRPNPFIQHGTNLLGAVLLGFSLLVNTNPASLVLEMFWLAISSWGLVKAVVDRKKRDA